MKLKSVHAIYRKPGQKQVRVEPGTEFECPETEAQDYLATGAAVAVGTSAKKPAAKKAAKKEPVVDPSSVKGESGQSGDDGDDLLA